MMEECKRIKNGLAPRDSLLFAIADPVETVSVTLIDGTSPGGDAAELAEQRPGNAGDDFGDLCEPENLEGGAAELAAENSENESKARNGKPTAQASSKGGGVPKLQVLRATTSIRDDWLHRGTALADFDLYAYTANVERFRLPRRVQFDKQYLRQPGPPLFLFDEHYPLSTTYCQRFLGRGVVPRVVGPSCCRSDVHGGEENAVYKAILFTPLRCPGAGSCADVLSCEAAVFLDQNNIHSFAAAWKARRAEIETLAQAGQEKTNRAKRIPVVKDTTVFKECSVARSCDSEQSGKDAAELLAQKIQESKEFAPTLIRLCLEQHLGNLLEKGDRELPRGMVWNNTERILQVICQCLDIHSGPHPDQLHLAEYVAYKARDVLFNLDLSVDARSSAVNTIAASKGQLTVEDDGPDPFSDPPGVYDIENVGGDPEDEDLGDGATTVDIDNKVEIMARMRDAHAIQNLLSRRREIEAGHIDANTMKSVDDIQKATLGISDLVNGGYTDIQKAANSNVRI